MITKINMIFVIRQPYFRTRANCFSRLCTLSSTLYHASAKFPTCHQKFYLVPDFMLHDGLSIKFFSSSIVLSAELQSDISRRSVDYEVLWRGIVADQSTESRKALKNINFSTQNISPIPVKPEPKEDKNDNKKPTLWQRTKKEILHYYHGFRLLGLEVKIASGMCFRVFMGHTLTRRERKQLVRTVADIIRLVPFAVFIIVPFMEFLLPLYLKFFPFMLPSTFKDKSAEANKLEQTLKAKIEMTRFLQETLNQTTAISKTDSNSPTVAEFQSFIKQLQESGQPAEAEDIIKFSKLFEDQVTLESLDNKQLRMLCRLLSVPAIGPSNLLRFQIWMRVRQLKAEDLLLAKEGVDNIPPFELQSLCQERGMRSFGLSQERLRSQLSQWLTLHLEKNVPITLLLFSRSLHITQTETTDLPILQAIAQLPASATEEAAARVLESTPHSELDPKLKLEVLRKEQANIKAVRAQRKQELAEQQKAGAATAAMPTPEALIDKAETIKGLQDEDLMKSQQLEPPMKTTEQIQGIDQLITDLSASPKVPSKPTDLGVICEAVPGNTTLNIVETTKSEKTEHTKKDEDTEISVGDLAEIKTAIASSSDVLDHEALHGLKEEVAETAKVQQMRQKALVMSELPTKPTSKAATVLETRVGRMIKEMDTMINKLSDERRQLLKDIELREVHIKHSTEPTEKTEILDAIKADHDKVVDINDLMLSLKRIQKVPDDTKWQKILQVLDEDRDGKIELKHVLSVIKLLGSENVKLSSKEIKRVLEMIDNEDLASVIAQEVSSSDIEPTTPLQSTETSQSKPSKNAEL